MTFSINKLAIALALLISPLAQAATPVSQTINGITVTAQALSIDECQRLSPYAFHMHTLTSDSYIPEVICCPITVVYFSIANNSNQDVILDWNYNPKSMNVPSLHAEEEPEDSEDPDILTCPIVEMASNPENYFDHSLISIEAGKHLLKAISTYSAVNNDIVIESGKSFTTHLFIMSENSAPKNINLFATLQEIIFNLRIPVNHTL